MGGAAAGAFTGAGVAGAATAGAASAATNVTLLKDKLAGAFEFAAGAFNHAAGTLRGAKGNEQESTEDTEATDDVPEHDAGNARSKL